MDRAKLDQKSKAADRHMHSIDRAIDRQAFERGVNDALTFASLRQFWRHYATSRAFGLPLFWSIRTAWGWRYGPTRSLTDARADYIKATNRS